MKLAVRTLVYGFFLFAATFAGLLTGHMLQSAVAYALTGSSETRPGLETLLIGSLVVGAIVAFIFEDL